jgi:hypothetical protein
MRCLGYDLQFIGQGRANLMDYRPHRKNNCSKSGFNTRFGLRKFDFMLFSCFEVGKANA